jgi:hypothetical protein
MFLYKMNPYFYYQSWFDSDGVYVLIEKHKERFMYNFGTDCTWKNIHTGELINTWDNSMIKLDQLEQREEAIDLILIDNI